MTKKFIYNHYVPTKHVMCACLYLCRCIYDLWI